MQIIGVIPARMAATRFPGKPLADLEGRPLVRWVYESAAQCDDLDELLVATPDAEIVEVVEAFGGRAELTRDDHLTGTDRVAEVSSRHPAADVVANIQGDQPFVSPAMISALVGPYQRGDRPEMTTVAAPLDLEAGMHDPNVVKVVCDQRGDGLYFSRSPIPFQRGEVVGSLPVYHHIGLYAFTREFLAQYSTMESTPLEQAEGLEQLRALEHGYRIRVCPIEQSVLEVNTPEELAKAVEFVQRGGVA
jgi:3-deoxy-manno-octulosonate cytidylyltransferase (CMP-KDO synthetase)